MNRIFLFDVDGTLVMNRIIPNSAIRTIKKLRLNNDIVLLSTGRCKGQLNDLLSKIEVDGAICNNGAYLYIGAKELFKSPIDKKIINDMLNDNLHLAYLSDKYFIINDDPIYDDIASYFKIDKAILLDKSYLNEDIYSLNVIDFDINRIDINKYNLNFIKVYHNGYDVINKGINKSSPIEIIRKMYPNYQIISFGDNYNDIDMLKKSDISIAMANAPDEVKKISTFVTKGPLEDGIEYAINNYLERL